jgi:hypothetical protein
MTDGHGHASYAHLGIPISAKPSSADYFIYGDAGDWWEPDFDELCEAMWAVYNDYEPYAKQAKFSAEVIRSRFTWKHTTDRFLELMAEPMGVPYTGDGSWCEAERRLYKIIVTEDHSSHAAGVFREFKKGQVYYDLADIKRILFDAGKLDPACLEEDDLGLAPEQLDGLDEYKASRAYCPHCGQRLNTVPTRSDDIMAGVTE